MPDRLPKSIRRASAAHFVALGALVALSLVSAVGWLAMRVDDAALAHIVLLIGFSGCVILGLIAWIAARHDERVVRPAAQMLAHCEDIISAGQSADTDQSISTLKELVRQRTIHDAMVQLRLEVDRSKTGGPHARIHCALNTLQEALDETDDANGAGWSDQPALEKR